MSDADVKSTSPGTDPRPRGGANPEWGRKPQRPQRDEIEEVLKGADMSCSHRTERVAAPATGGAPVIAAISRKLARLPSACHAPILLRGQSGRAGRPTRGIEALRAECDTADRHSDDRLLQISEHNVSVMDAFRSADQCLLSGVQGITT